MPDSDDVRGASMKNTHKTIHILCQAGILEWDSIEYPEKYTLTIVCDVPFYVP